MCCPVGPSCLSPTVHKYKSDPSVYRSHVRLMPISRRFADTTLTWSRPTQPTVGMPPRRPQYTQESIDQHLQQIHLLDQSSSSENLEQLGPIIKQVHANRQQEIYLRTLQGLIESKDAEIERICGENYRDFISSVSTLFSIKSHTTVLSNKISSLDTSVSQVGHGLVEKKRALLQSKKTAANLDEAIDTLQACLRVLDVVYRVGEMVKERKYWSALRVRPCHKSNFGALAQRAGSQSLEDIQSMPPTSLSQTPLFQHLVSSLPSLRTQIKDAVTSSTKQWLWDIRNISGQVGKLAIEAMDTRTRRWRSRRERDPMTKHSKVGNAVELVAYEKTECNTQFSLNPRIAVDVASQLMFLITASSKLTLSRCTIAFTSTPLWTP